jgi:hypothetical protein
MALNFAILPLDKAIAELVMAHCILPALKAFHAGVDLRLGLTFSGWHQSLLVDLEIQTFVDPYVGLGGQLVVGVRASDPVTKAVLDDVSRSTASMLFDSIRATGRDVRIGVHPDASDYYRLTL